VCDNIRIRRCKLYPLEDNGEAFRGYMCEQTPLLLRVAGAPGGKR
jgi:hypothetical protein